MSEIIYNEHDDVALDYDPNRVTMSEETIRQTLAYCIVPDPMLVPHAKALGLHPVSEEVAEAEFIGAAARLNRVGPLLPLLTILARLTTEVQNGAILVRKAEDPTIEIDEVAANQTLSATVGILATLLDMGVVQVAVPETIEVDES